MQVWKLRVLGLTLGRGLGLATVVVSFASSPVRAEVDPPPAILHRAELDGPDLKLCVERGDRYETLRVDSQDPDAPLLSEPGCADFGRGERLPILDEERPGAVFVEGRIAVYIDEDGNVLRIPLDLDPEDGVPYEEPYEPDESEELEPQADPCAGERCIRRVPTRRGSSRIVLPGPRAGEIGDATRDATLGGLEQTLDPVIEPPLALTLRGVSAAVGFAVGAALYVPTTLLDVLETEYGVDGPDGGPVECDPYDPYDDHGRHRGCR
jgi:hypothetical protein